MGHYNGSWQTPTYEVISATHGHEVTEALLDHWKFHDYSTLHALPLYGRSQLYPGIFEQLHFIGSVYA